MKPSTSSSTRRGGKSVFTNSAGTRLTPPAAAPARRPSRRAGDEVRGAGARLTPSAAAPARRLSQRAGDGVRGAGARDTAPHLDSAETARRPPGASAGARSAEAGVGLRAALPWDLHLLAHALARPPEKVARQVLVLWQAPRRTRQWAEALLLAARDAYPGADADQASGS